jgi:alpha-galactosidase
VGIFNLGPETAGCKLNFKEIGAAGKSQVRDLWRQKDLGAPAETFETKVPAHGVVLLRLSRAK